jgi:phosphoglycolate phosphatase
MHRSIIFDLDGTLIDSSPSILGCFARILRDARLQPVVPLDHTLIGPPLRSTLMKISGLAAGRELEELAAAFRAVYDSEGFRATRVYPGIEGLLSGLYRKGIRLSIATNKRMVPTLKILEHLEWKRYFARIGALDDPAAPQPDKASLLGSILRENGNDAAAAVYVGDKWEDGEAAASNKMPFYAAQWGYGAWTGVALPGGWHIVRTPEEMLNLFAGEGRPG